MGLFFWKSALERSLEREYKDTFLMLGMPKREAKRLARTVIVTAKERDRDNPGPPAGHGDAILAQESIGQLDDKTKNWLNDKRVEGVTDDDIRWFWNMTPVERWCLIVTDDIFRLARFKELRASGLSAEAATERIRGMFPIFGNPNDQTSASGENRPLPFELKDRVNKWINRQRMTGPDKGAEPSGSMNALIRAEMRAGNI